MAITIYGLSNPDNDIIRYIGKTVDLDKRYKAHIKEALYGKRKSKKNTWLNALLIKNISPNIQVIDIVADEDGNFYERQYIKLFKSVGCNLLNMTQGGDGGAMNPEIAKASGLLRRGKEGHNKGLIMSQEVKNKISQSKLGKNKGSESVRSKAIFQIDKCTGLVICEFINITEAGKVFGKRTSINNALKGVSKTSCGFKWIYKK